MPCKNMICTEGVNFEVDIIRQLMLEGTLVEELGVWQQQQMNIGENDLDRSWGDWIKEDITYITGGEGTWIYYLKIREWEKTVQLGLKKLISYKLGVSEDRVGDNITVGYSQDEYHRPIIARLNYQYRTLQKSFKEKGEYWQVINEESEKLTEDNECHEINRNCLDSGNKLFFNNYHVSRPCWKEQISYQCTSQPQDGCKSLKAQGCQLENSNCLKRYSNLCLLWQRNYSCFIEKKELSSSLQGASMFCLGGDCFAPTIEQNTDISNVGYLAMLNEMKKDMQSEPIEVFKGEGNGCRKNIVNFLNCCSSMKGWGKDLGLGRCKATEKALALKRSKGQCHFVGSYCSERDPVFNKCLTKKSTYCCFNSKLARIFQEQGKEQLGIGFGSPEFANCRGFTVEELQTIDFSKFNMEELFADLLVEAKSKMGKSFPHQLHNQMPVMQKQLLINGKSHNPNLSY